MKTMKLQDIVPPEVIGPLTSLIKRLVKKSRKGRLEGQNVHSLLLDVLRPHEAYINQKGVDIRYLAYMIENMIRQGQIGNNPGYRQNPPPPPKFTPSARVRISVAGTPSNGKEGNIIGSPRLVGAPGYYEYEVLIDGHTTPTFWMESELVDARARVAKFKVGDLVEVRKPGSSYLGIKGRVTNVYPNQSRASFDYDIDIGTGVPVTFWEESIALVSPASLPVAPRKKPTHDVYGIPQRFVVGDEVKTQKGETGFVTKTWYDHTRGLFMIRLRSRKGDEWDMSEGNAVMIKKAKFFNNPWLMAGPQVYIHPGPGEVSPGETRQMEAGPIQAKTEESKRRPTMLSGGSKVQAALPAPKVEPKFKMKLSDRERKRRAKAARRMKRTRGGKFRTNPPISDTWDKIGTIRREHILSYAGFPRGSVYVGARTRWVNLPDQIKSRLETTWQSNPWYVTEQDGWVVDPTPHFSTESAQRAVDEMYYRADQIGHELEPGVHYRYTPEQGPRRRGDTIRPDGTVEPYSPDKYLNNPYAYKIWDHLTGRYLYGIGRHGGTEDQIWKTKESAEDWLKHDLMLQLSGGPRTTEQVEQIVKKKMVNEFEIRPIWVDSTEWRKTNWTKPLDEPLPNPGYEWKPVLLENPRSQIPSDFVKVYERRTPDGRTVAAYFKYDPSWQMVTVRSTERVPTGERGGEVEVVADEHDARRMWNFLRKHGATRFIKEAIKSKRLKGRRAFERKVDLTKTERPLPDQSQAWSGWGSKPTELTPSKPKSIFVEHAESLLEQIDHEAKERDFEKAMQVLSRLVRVKRTGELTEEERTVISGLYEEGKQKIDLVWPGMVKRYAENVG